MTDETANDLEQAMQETIEYLQGKRPLRTWHIRVPANVDVAGLRKQLKMTQKQFCETYGFNLYTLRHWERGDRNPDAHTRSYLHVINKIPDQVRSALRD